jgi:hypothetical protein
MRKGQPKRPRGATHPSAIERPKDPVTVTLSPFGRKFLLTEKVLRQYNNRAANGGRRHGDKPP